MQGGHQTACCPSPPLITLASASSHCVMLLDCFNVQPFQLHHRLDVPFERVKLSKPIAANRERNMVIHRGRSYIYLMSINTQEKNGNLPCNLSSPLGLFCNLRQLSVAALLREEISSFWWMKPMEGSLSKSPLSLSLFPAIVFLGGKGSLLLRRVSVK